ncbi:MAG TPA: cyanophycin synthetase [Clostridiales bacterium]|nr:cyanophycin synthetase [Clostridiales bacterium]
MQIISINSLRGRNIYSHNPVIKMVVDISPYGETPTSRLKSFNKNIIKLLPGLKEHHCSKDIPLGFVQRLEEGTYLAHVIEHVALEIQNILGYDVAFGRARETETRDVYSIIYAYEIERVGIGAGRLAVEIVDALARGRVPKIKGRLNKLKKIGRENDFGPSTKAIIQAAKERGIPVNRIGKSNFVQLGYGKYKKRLEATISENTGCISVDIACNKTITKEVLESVGIPVPRGGVCTSLREALEICDDIGYPVVIKPEKGNQGKGVSLNINSSDEVKLAFKLAKRIDKNVIVEKYIPGNDYRILVVQDRVVAVAQRIPAHVVGDGHSTVEQLVRRVNQRDDRGDDHEKPLTKIKIDEISHYLLKKQGLDTGSVPAKGRIVYLKPNANLSTGGIAIDVTDKIHPYNIDIALRAARAIGLDVAGIDVSIPDIALPMLETGGAVLEVNAAPGIRMHHYPSQGRGRNVGKAIVDMLYPLHKNYTIPIVSVTGTNGKTTTARMISHIIRGMGLTVGMTSTGGIFINDKCILKGDTTGFESAQIVLQDKSVEAAVLETARGGIIRSGLGYDLANVGIITNISEDHLGVDGIYTLEDMAFVKSLVVEAVKDDGYSVLNADDPIVVSVSSRARGSIIYFSRCCNNIIVQKHVSQGNTGVVLKENFITVINGETTTKVIEVNQIPATLGGRLKYNIENSLAAVAACCALNIPVDIIFKGLKTFYTDELQNPGRFNIFNVGNFRVVVDYGHNKAGYKAVLEGAKKMGATRLVGIIGVPGDRDNESIMDIGKICGQMLDEIIIKEDSDTRGRKVGEVSRLLEMGVISSGKSRKAVKIILREEEALKHAMYNAQPGDMIIIFYEKLDVILDIIKEYSKAMEQTLKKQTYMEAPLIN